jgi:hypothetical protein
MKKISLLFVVCIFLLSCEKKIGGPVPDTMINITYRDQKGFDLLSSTNTEYIANADIDVYLLTPQNDRRRLYKSNLDMPKHFRIEKQANDSYTLTLFFEPDLDCIDNNKMATLYLTYKNRSEDKFVGKFNRTKFPRTLEKLWINDKLVWEINSSSQRKVTLIK